MVTLQNGNAFETLGEDISGQQSAKSSTDD
jgi:hypothetical protein